MWIYYNLGTASILCLLGVCLRVLGGGVGVPIGILSGR